MLFNRHYNLEGRHARLSASKHAWSNYNDEHFDRMFYAAEAAARGTRLHKLAHDLIKEGQKLPANKKTLNMYVNDALGFRMRPEQPLRYSDNAFGTPDAISFRKERGFDKEVLRIHDLKTGTGHASIRQLEIYAAFFCLEYRISPFKMMIILRIYQNNEIQEFEADPDDIFHLMEKVIEFDKRINELLEEAMS